MKAGVLNKIDELEFMDMDKPILEQGDILVKVMAAALCGTDLRIFHGSKTKGVRYPSIIGHEFSGKVVEVGRSVMEYSVGDRITADPVLPCGGCEYCLSGMENVCLNREALGYEYDGCFAEYIRIPEKFIKRGNIQLLPVSIGYRSAALAEPLACVINGQRKLDISTGNKVVIIGAGPIGLMHMLIARASGASKIIISEPNDYRRNVAKSMGANVVINPIKDNLLDIVKEHTGGIGADVIICAIGNPKIVNDALLCARKGGRISLFAGFSKDITPEVDVNLIHYNELVVIGASSLQRRDIKTALNLIEGGIVDVEQLVTKTFPLKQIEEAFKVAEAGNELKVIIEP
jgi:L-iditol 2-dehydrogenase